ncbi:MAG TPA: Ig-like domain-containing protein [Vicinamibacterales bacterium]|nr:Ig-like domain-containing protein [Vicinamibacterales bacterium]
MLRTLLVSGLVALGAASYQSSPPATRLATSAEALVASPVFFHGREIAVHARVIESRGLAELSGTAKPVFVYWKEQPASTSDGEVRGAFWDLGRLRPDDSRFASIDFAPALQAVSNGEWPGRGELFVILNATFVDSPLPVEPTIRAIALAPAKYADTRVTLVGRFRGNNLYGDLPVPVGKSRWDFVLQAADGAVWVTGVRPRGKGFDLDPTARVDTGVWLEVAGMVRHEGALVWIEAASVARATAPAEAPVEVTVPLPPAPVPQVIFTAPLANDVDVSPSSTVRLQFSRDMNPGSFKGHVHVTYTGTAPTGAPAAPPPFTIDYNEGNRALEITFSAPLDRFRTVRVDLLDGIESAIDRQPLAPWSMTFTTGG